METSLSHGANTNHHREDSTPRKSAEPLDRYCAARFTYLTVDQWRKEILAGKVSIDDVAVPDLATTLQGGECSPGTEAGRQTGGR